MTKFILDKSNARERTIEILDKHCEKFEGWNPELMEFVMSDEILNEIIDAIEEGLDNLGDKVAFSCTAEDFDVDIDVTVSNMQGGLFSDGVINPEFSRLVKLYIFAENFASEDDYTVCDNVYYRIDMFREE